MSVISLPRNYANRFSATSAKNKISWAENLDLPLVLSALVLLGLGLVMVASSSISIAERQLSEPLYYFWRQFSYSAVGLLVAFIVFKIPLNYLQKSGPVLMVISFILLVMVLISTSIRVCKTCNCYLSCWLSCEA